MRTIAMLALVATMVTTQAATISEWNFNFGNDANTSTGALRFDMVTITGDAVPEPASMIALGAGLAAFVTRRRLR